MLTKGTINCLNNKFYKPLKIDFRPGEQCVIYVIVTQANFPVQYFVPRDVNKESIISFAESNVSGYNMGNAKHGHSS